MSYCNACPRPGHCCQGFILQKWFDLRDWQIHAQQEMDDRKLPFRPVAVASMDLPSGKCCIEFDCPELRDDGRCGIYYDRPATCKEFEPGSNCLCILPSN